MAPRYFLKTDLETYLFRGLEDRLIHLPLIRRPLNLQVELEWERPDCSTLVGFFKVGENSTVPVVTEWLGDGKVALRTRDGYLMAASQGAFNLREHVETCTRFKPVSEKEAAADSRVAARIEPLERAYRIPKIIHQIYIGNNVLSQAIEQNIKHLESLNAGWELRLWDDDSIPDCISEAFGTEILKSFLRINPSYAAARADFFRYLCVYKFGGVYLDIKSGAVVPLDTIIRPEDQFLLSHWPQNENSPFRGYGRHPELTHISPGEYQQWHVIAAPGHPFLERVINDMLANIEEYHQFMDGVGRWPTLRVTGPVSYTLSISKILEKYGHRFFDAALSGLVYRKIENFYADPQFSYMLQTTPLIF